MKDETEEHRWSNCKGNHAAWSRNCSVVKEQQLRVQIAYSNRPTAYRVEPDHIRQLSKNTTSSQETEQTSPNSANQENKDETSTQITREANTRTTKEMNDRTAICIDLDKIRNGAAAPREQMDKEQVMQPPTRKRARKRPHFVYEDEVHPTVETACQETIASAITNPSNHTHSERSRRSCTIINNSQELDTNQRSGLLEQMPARIQEELWIKWRYHF